MKNINDFFSRVLAAIFFVVGAVLMLFSNTLLSGIFLLVLGFLVSLNFLNNNKKLRFSDSFLFISAVLALIIVTYTYFISYSKNIIIISTSYYALNFLIQVNSLKSRRITVVKKIRKVNESKVEKIKDAINDLKKEISKNKEVKKIKKEYFYTKKGKSFHVGGCIALSRTKQENLIKSNSRQSLISKGYKTCKACNS